METFKFWFAAQDRHKNESEMRFKLSAWSNDLSIFLTRSLSPSLFLSIWPLQWAAIENVCWNAAHRIINDEHKQQFNAAAVVLLLLRLQ